MIERTTPGIGHALAEKLHTAGRIMSEVRDAMVLAEIPYVLSQQLWELEEELHRIATDLQKVQMRLGTLAGRIEAEDNLKSRR